MTDPDRAAPPSTRPPVAAPIERREFLRLGLGGAALIVGCGDVAGEPRPAPVLDMLI